MKVVITQPNYLPWIGYFHQIFEADLFVVLDNVQYSRREWQNRNRIVQRDGRINYLTIPVKKAPQKAKIYDIFVSDNFSVDSALRQIDAAYPRLSGTKQARELVVNTHSLRDLSSGNVRLVDINLDFINAVASGAGISTKFVRASSLPSLDVGIAATDRLLEICKQLNATHYLSSLGARGYMISGLNKFNEAGIEVLWQSFEHLPYAGMQGQPFVSHLSVIDYLVHRPLESLAGYIVTCGRFCAEDEIAATV